MGTLSDQILLANCFMQKNAQYAGFIQHVCKAIYAQYTHDTQEVKHAIDEPQAIV